MNLPDYVNKSVSFNFFGKKLNFRLSQSLFSSFDIDPGSRLLLKHLVPFLKKPGIRSILDIGCGTGVLGLSITSAIEKSECLLEDRDALAIAFAEDNAASNGLSGQCSFRTAPSFTSDYTKFDLVVSNIPAKAGEPVISEWTRRTGSILSGNGIAAFVIVKPLADMLKTRINNCGYSVLEYFENKQYAVCIFNSEKSGHIDHFGSSFDSSIDLYIRNETEFTYSDKHYKLKTVYNLPDFDQHGYDIKCAIKSLKNFSLEGKSVFINPGQGHIPAFLYSNSMLKGPAVLCSRDSLSIETSSLNLARYLDSERLYTPFIESFLTENSLQANFICVNYSEQLSLGLADEFAESISAALSSDGRLLLYGKISRVNSLFENLSGFKLIKQNKNKGFRSILVKKSAILALH